MADPPPHDGRSAYDREYFEGGTRSGYRGLTTSLYGRAYGVTVGLIRALGVHAFLRPRSLLDVGCGPGDMVTWLRRLGVDAWGADISPYIIGRAAAPIRPYLRRAGIAELPFRDGRFEMVTSFDVLEHVPQAELPRAALECARVTGGQVFHRVCTSDSLHHRALGHRDQTHVSMFPDAWWRGLFARLGFRRPSVFFPRFQSGGWYLLLPPA